jgi:transcriptional regulator with XRE-family HTH domain
MASRASVSLSMVRRIERGGNTTLALAEKVAAAFGKPLSELVAPVACGVCFDSPEPGFACLECGAKGPEVTR